MGTQQLTGFAPELIHPGRTKRGTDEGERLKELVEQVLIEGRFMREARDPRHAFVRSRREKLGQRARSQELGSRISLREEVPHLAHERRIPKLRLDYHQQATGAKEPSCFPPGELWIQPMKNVGHEDQVK